MASTGRLSITAPNADRTLSRVSRNSSAWTVFSRKDRTSKIKGPVGLGGIASARAWDSALHTRAVKYSFGGAASSPEAQAGLIWL